MTAFIYPVVVSWSWGGGWLDVRGYKDFAGSGNVHLVGGTAGLVGCLLTGPRHGKEKDIATRANILDEKEFIQMRSKVIDEDAFVEWIQERETDFQPYSTPFIVLGTFMLWVSWLFFNGGSNLAMGGTARYQGVPKIIMNTILSGAAGGLVATVLKPIIMGTYSKTRRYDIAALSNGVLGGLVSVTASC